MLLLLLRLDSLKWNGTVIITVEYVRILKEAGSEILSHH
jgi:hypothetical protein